MPTQANAEHDPQHQHDVVQRSYKAPDFVKTDAKENVQQQQEEVQNTAAWKDAGSIQGKLYAKEKGNKEAKVHTYYLSAPLKLGNIDDWRAVLAQGDDNFKEYLLTFLLLATEPSLKGGDAKAFASVLNPYFNQHGGQMITEEQMYAEDSGGLFHILRAIVVDMDTHLIADFKNSIADAPSPEDIMNFMMALYTNDGKLDLPDVNGWDGAGGAGSILWAKVAQSLTNDKLATLIAKHQDKVIVKKSEKTMDSIFKRKSGTTLASQGTARGEMYGPVIESMIYSGLSTAISASKASIINLMNKEADFDPKNRQLSFRIVRNSAKLIGDALKTYDGKLIANEALMATIFNSVWMAIPKPVLSAGLKSAWTTIDAILKGQVYGKIKGDFAKITGAKDWQDDVAREYSNTLDLMIELMRNKPEFKGKADKLEMEYRTLDNAFRANINQK